VTISLNIAVTGIGEVFVGLGAADVRVTVGAVVSILMFLLAPSDPAAPGAGRVKTALLFPESLIKPPFSVREDVAT
jgi:hypothetical protein